MRKFLKYIVILSILLFAYFCIIFPIRQWQCEQVGMRASHWVNGCIINKD